MNTWQSFLIIVGALVVGSGLGFVAIRFISRRKQTQDSYPQLDITNHTNSVSNKANSLGYWDASPNSKPGLQKPAPAVSVPNRPAVNSTEDSLELLLQERKKTVPPTLSLKLENTGILAELVSNLSIATTPVNSKLLLFQTKYWDGNQNSSETLINKYKEELTQAYTDIRLANVIVWLSNDLGHTSPELEKSYTQLCTKITDRLTNIVTAQIADRNS